MSEPSELCNRQLAERGLFRFDSAAVARTEPSGSRKMASQSSKLGRIPAKVNFRLTASRRGKNGPVGRVLGQHKNQTRPFALI